LAAVLKKDGADIVRGIVDRILQMQELSGRTGQDALVKEPDRARFTIVFDREAYDLGVFRQLWDKYRIAVRTLLSQVKQRSWCPEHAIGKLAFPSSDTSPVIERGWGAYSSAIDRLSCFDFVRPNLEIHSLISSFCLLKSVS